MTADFIMTSVNIQKHFPEVYRDFFSAAEKIASAPHSFFWSGEIIGFYGGLTINQKIPLRVYVGLEPIEKDSLEIEANFLAFDPSEDKFVPIDFEHFQVDDLKVFLKDKLKGFRIIFLSELRVGANLGFIGAVSAALATLLTNDEKEKFPLAWQIAKVLQYQSSGASSFAALSNSPYPSIYRNLSNGKYWGKTFDQLFSDFSHHSSSGIDFGIIFSGVLINVESVQRAAKSAKEILNQRGKKSEEIIKKETSEDFWDTYQKILDLISQQTLISLKEIFVNGNRNENLRFLFNSMNLYQNLLHYLELSTPAINQIYRAIHHLTTEKGDMTGAGVKFSGIGKGGSILFALSYSQFRDDIVKIVKKIPQTGLYYASWRDGIEKEGAKIEQDLTVGKIHSILPIGLKKLTILKNGFFAIKLVEEAPTDLDVVFDMSKKRVLVAGLALTSQTLPSQSATVLLMEKLIKTKKRSLKNSELPVKAYQNSRYDLQGKIIIPLQKIIEKETKKKLPFQLTGEIYDNYELSLLPGDYTIGILEDLF